MPRTNIKDLPPEPKRRRRGSRDLYEVIALMLWVLFLFSTLAILFLSKGQVEVNDYQFQWEYMKEVTYVLASLWVLCSVALFLFDNNSISRENEEFEYHMKNFRELRDDIIALEKEKIEIEKKKLAQENTKE